MIIKIIFHLTIFLQNNAIASAINNASRDSEIDSIHKANNVSVIASSLTSPISNNTEQMALLSPANIAAVDTMNIAEEPHITSTEETTTNKALNTNVRKRGRAKGKAAVITDSAYKENLIAEKLKNIKKEPQTTAKRPKLSDVTAKQNKVVPTKKRSSNGSKKLKKKKSSEKKKKF